MLTLSAATIDRYLKPSKAADAISGCSTTKASPLLRSSIKIRKAGDEVEAEPGFFEGDTVAHCGPTMKGEFVQTLNLTCVYTGWSYTTSVRNNAHTHILAALNAALSVIPFEVTGVAFDNGSEFLNHDVIGWAGQHNEPPRDVRRVDSLEGSLSWHDPTGIRPSCVGARCGWLSSLGRTTRTSQRRSGPWL